MENDQFSFSPLGSDDLDLRNCPTPDITDPLNFSDYDFDDEQLLKLLHNPNMDPIQNNDAFVGYQPDDNNNNTDALLNIDFTQYDTATLLQSSSSSSTPGFINSNTSSPFSFLKEETDSFVPIGTVPLDMVPIEVVHPVAGSSREEDNQTPFVGDSTMTSTSGRKSVVMTKNAVLARQNRERKKQEQKDISKRMAQLEEENAELKKKASEHKAQYENARQRIVQLEAVLQNLPEIVTMMEHMNAYPGNKGSGTKKS